jgi:2-methylcitrate dehydratase PrpD
MAALANGASAHAFEIDDVHEEAVSHPGAVVVPAALAVAEETGASGLALLEAVVVGYEAMGRAGLAVGPVSHMLAGFHPTSMSGVFGAAAAAAHLRGLDADRLNHALGVAASLASGTMEFAASGGMAKRVHAARAAEGGIMAAALAADGFEGARDGLAGRYGFCRIFTDDPQPRLLTDRLGERWLIDEITVKPYPSCSDLHPMVQATSELVAMHGLVADDIGRVAVHVTTKVAELNDMDGAQSVMAAQYSAQFNVAAAVVADPSDPATFDPRRIGDPALAAVQAKVGPILPAPEFDATYAWKQGARVEITTTDGRVLERTVHGQRGSMHDPLSDDEIERKFQVVASGRLDPAIPEVVRSLPTGQLDDLTRLLRRAGPSAGAVESRPARSNPGPRRRPAAARAAT